MTWKGLGRAGVALLNLLGVTAGGALCAGPGTEQAPVSEHSLPWTAIAYLLVALAAVCVVGFKNARRTHLD